MSLASVSGVRNPWFVWLRLLELVCQRARRRLGVGDDREVGGAVAPDRPRLDVDLDHPRRRADHRAVLGRPVVDRRAEHEHDVGFGEDSGGERAGETARDAERIREPREQAVGRRGRRQDRADPLAEALELRAGAGEHRTPAGDDRGSFGFDDYVYGLVDGLGCRLGRAQCRHRGSRRLDLDRRLGLDVDREHQHDRPALCCCALVGTRGVVGGGLRAVYPVGDRPDRLDQVVLIDPEVRSQRRRRRLAREHEHRCTTLGGLGKPGHRVGQPRSLVHAANADRARDAGVAVGHADRAALVAGVVEPSAVPAERVGDDQVAAAEDAERILDPLRGDRGADDVGYR